MDLSTKTHMASASGYLYLLTHRFADGHYLGFWANNLHGHARPKDRGWVVLSQQGEVVDLKQTYDWGPVPRSEAFREWRRRQKQIHGPAKKLFNHYGKQWRMTEVV